MNFKYCLFTALLLGACVLPQKKPAAHHTPKANPYHRLNDKDLCYKLAADNKSKVLASEIKKRDLNCALLLYALQGQEE